MTRQLISKPWWYRARLRRSTLAVPPDQSVHGIQRGMSRSTLPVRCQSATEHALPSQRPGPRSATPPIAWALMLYGLVSAISTHVSSALQSTTCAGRGDAPDPLTTLFLSSARLPEFANEARTAFFNTLGVVMGPYWAALQKERDRAKAWLKALTDSSANNWAASLVAAYDHDIEVHRQREAEEDFKLGL